MLSPIDHVKGGEKIKEYELSWSRRRFVCLECGNRVDREFYNKHSMQILMVVQTRWIFKMVCHELRMNPLLTLSGVETLNVNRDHLQLLGQFFELPFPM